MAGKRAKNLDDKTVQLLVQMLDGWTGDLSWALFIDAIARKTRCTYTRQALHRHQRILEAFQLRKEYFGKRREGGQRVPESLSVAEIAALIERCDRLTAENIRLKAENERLLAQFNIWAYNAHTRGLGEEFLNRPLPPIDRDTTKLEIVSRRKSRK